MAVSLRNPPPGCLLQSDSGSQYCAYDYQKKLQAYRLPLLLSGKGNCYDNASIEMFYKSLKVELIWRQNGQREGRQRPLSSSTSKCFTTPVAATHI
jgi:transposase InsO family protein